MNPDQPHTTGASNSNVVYTADMFVRLLAGQEQMSSDIRLLRQSVDPRFEALESRVSALEATLSTDNSAHLRNEMRSLAEKVNTVVSSANVKDQNNVTDSTNKLALRDDNMENRSRRNNIIQQGLPEVPDETNDALLSKVFLWFSDTLKMQCPRIERLHRIRVT